MDCGPNSEIAKKLEISAAAATKVIKRMEALHYIHRAPDPSDERISRVFLEEEGWRVINQIKTAFSKIDKILFCNLSPQEQSTLVMLLTRIYDSLYTSQTGRA